MNPSHAYPDRAPRPRNYAGIGLVIAVHLAVICGLSAGLVKVPPKPAEIITLKPLPPEVVRDPLPPQDPIKAAKPVLQAPVVEVPVPPVWTDAPPLRVDAVTTSEAPPASIGASTGGAIGTTQAPPKAEPLIRAPGAVCSVMPRPEVPAVNWSGEAVLQVVATVRGGRVVGSELRVTQGALDGKTRRSLQRAVEAALAGYQCQGDAVFQQDFAFRLD